MMNLASIKNGTGGQPPNAPAPRPPGSPEPELLLLCARTHADDAVFEKIGALLQQRLDWAWFVDACFRHGVMPLVYRTLRQVSGPGVPSEVMKALEDGFRLNRVRSMALSAELIRVLDAFRDAEIPAIPIKGPTLAESAFGDVSLRSFGDLDLLLQPEDIPAAVRCLEGLGYESTVRGAQLAPALRFHYHLVLVRASDRSTVELHWRLASPVFGPCPAVNVLLRDTRPGCFAGSEVPLLSPEITLLALCFHGGKHWWNRVSYISAVAGWLESHPTVDWRRLWQIVNAAGCCRIVSVGLILAHDMLAARLPPDVNVRLDRCAGARHLAHRARNWLFDGTDFPPGRFAGPLYYLGLRESPLDQVRVLGGLLFFPRKEDWSIVELPPALTGAYYLVRPLRLLRDVLVRVQAKRKARWAE